MKLTYKRTSISFYINPTFIAMIEPNNDYPDNTGSIITITGGRQIKVNEHFTDIIGAICVAG